MSIEREYALVGEAQEGSDMAFAELVWAHKGRIMGIVARYSSSSAPPQDLLQEGYLGLLTAIRRFDPARGVRLWTYARSWVRARVSLFAAKNRQIVPEVSTRAYRVLVPNMGRVEQVLLQKHGMSPSVDEIAGAMHVDVADVARVRRAMGVRDEPYDDDHCPRAAASVGDGLDDRYIAMIDAQGYLTAVRSALSKLSSRERGIIELRHRSEDTASLTELSKIYGISRERIRQIEVRALRKLRVAIEDHQTDHGR